MGQSNMKQNSKNSRSRLEIIKHITRCVKLFFRLNQKEKEILASLLIVVSVILFSVGVAMSIEVENSGSNFQTASYKFVLGENK